MEIYQDNSKMTFFNDVLFAAVKKTFIHEMVDNNSIAKAYIQLQE